MKSGRAALLAIALAVVVASCTTPEVRPRPTVTSTKPVPADEHVRPVRMTSGRALTYVQVETAAQILCQVIGAVDWERLLGGSVGRKPAVTGNVAECRIAAEDMVLAVSLYDDESSHFQANTTIAGRPAQEYGRTSDEVVFMVALTDEPAYSEVVPARRTLGVTARGDSTDEERDRSLRVLAEIVPLLAAEGESLPVPDYLGDVAYVHTPLAEGDQFIDLPRPVQALQLCGLLLEGLGLPATTVHVSAGGRCTLITDQPRVVVAMRSSGHSDFPDRIAGRAAHTESGSSVAVLLRDDSGIYLDVSAPDAVGLAEKIVPLLID